MKFIQSTPSLNGKYEASPGTSGASVISQPRTEFPQAHLTHSLRSLLYYSSRLLLGGIPLLRWLMGVDVVLAVVWAVGKLPGQWWVVALLLALLSALLAALHYWRRRDFVTLVVEQPPIPVPAPLPAQEKLPLYVTGYFGVENKYQRFTWLPGFYRTFATREHALLCQVTPRQSLPLGRWPGEEVGLWYIFFMPRDISRVAWGQLCFGRRAQRMIAITHQITIPKRGRFRPEQQREETVYLALESETDALTIWADLHHDLPSSAVVQMPSTAST
ncbi:MAG: hypothetical protein R3C14_29350 [Caldilineaceae bacterium]